MSPLFKKQLLAAICLTVLGIGSAQAIAISEDVFTGNDDFSNNLVSATMLPSNTTSVSGIIPSNLSDYADAFYIDGLTPGSIVNLHMTGTQSAMLIYSDLDFSARQDVLYENADIEVTVGDAGVIAFYMNSEGDPVSYSVSIDGAPSNDVPLAPTAALVGIGAVGLGLRRHKYTGSKTK